MALPLADGLDVRLRPASAPVQGLQELEDAARGRLRAAGSPWLDRRPRVAEKAAAAAEWPRVAEKAAAAESVGEARGNLPEQTVRRVAEKAAAAAAGGLEPGPGGACTCVQLALFEARLCAGLLCTSLAALVEVELAVGTGLPAAVALLRDAWEAGGLRVHGPVPEVLQRGWRAPDQWPAEAPAMGEACASVALARLSWEALRAVLLCFRRQRLRPTLGLLREMCLVVFGIAASEEDLVAAVSAGPPGACRVDRAPWPIPVDSATATDAAVVHLEECAPCGRDCVFPPYCLELEDPVEADLQDVGISLREMQAMVTPDLTVPGILSMAAARDCTDAFSGGALLWLWEKARTRSPGPPPDCTHRHRWFMPGESTADTLPFTSEVSADPSEDVFERACAEGPHGDDPGPRTSAIGSGRAGGALPAGPRTSTIGSGRAAIAEQPPPVGRCPMDSKGDACAREVVEDLHLHPTPHEAFVACFGPGILTGQVLALSQINNLYRMRSGGMDLKYRAHGYARMCDFLFEVAGIQVVGTDNKMAVKLCDSAEFAEVFHRLTQSMQRKAAELRKAGRDTSAMEVEYTQPNAVPEKVLARIWDIFQGTPRHEMQVSAFVSRYQERYRSENARLRSLGFQEIRGLMAHVPFIEKLGSRGYGKYVLKPGSQPPKLVRERARRGPAQKPTASTRGAAYPLAAARMRARDA